MDNQNNDPIGGLKDLLEKKTSEAKTEIRDTAKSSSKFLKRLLIFGAVLLGLFLFDKCSKGNAGEELRKEHGIENTGIVWTLDSLYEYNIPSTKRTMANITVPDEISNEDLDLWVKNALIEYYAVQSADKVIINADYKSLPSNGSSAAYGVYENKKFKITKWDFEKAKVMFK